ncbi:MAG TPA: arabinofuranosyltransferase [Thermoleophilaceae bacterium]
MQRAALSFPSDRRLRAATWPAAELALLLAGAALSAALVHVFLGAVNFQPVSQVARGLGPVWAALMIVVAVVAQLVQHRWGARTWSRAVVGGLAGIAAGLVTMPITAGLRGTSQPLNTIFGGDMTFRTEYVTRFASTWHLTDYTFKGLHAFYPPGWFWVAGRTAHVLGLHEPWHIMKPFTIFTIGAALVVAYLLWRSVLSPAGALCAAIGSSLVLSPQIGPTRFITQAWYEPYSCFVAVTGAAWVAATLHAIRTPAPRMRWSLILLGLVGVGLALSYYLLFILLAVVLIALAAFTPSAERRPALIRTGGLLAGIALLTAIFWVPLLREIAHGAASQGHFVRPDFFRVATGISGGPQALTILAIAALLALAFTFGALGSRAVAAVIAGTIVYQLISVATLVFAHNQLQPHRAVTMLWATIGASVPVALDRFRRSGETQRLFATLVLVVAIPATFVLGSAQGADLAGGPLSVRAHDHPPMGQARAISSFITRTTGKKPHQLTIVTGAHLVLIMKPYWGYLPLRARYAHPMAHLAQRIEVLRAAARCPNPACMNRILEHNKFGPIAAMVLAKTFLGPRIETQEDSFPDPIPIQIYFRRKNFAPADWVRGDFGPYVVFVHRRQFASAAGRSSTIRQSTPARARRSRSSRKGHHATT